MNILVIGASGNLGSEITKQLAIQHNVTGAVRNPETARLVAGVGYVIFDYDKPESFVEALQSIDAVVIQAPPLDASAFERLTPFIAAIKKAGIERVVFVSAYGVDHNDEAPLRKIELTLMAEGFNYTIVRPNFFSENFTSGFALAPLEHDGIVLSSAADGAIAFVSIKDIAAVIVASLNDAKHDKQAYTLTGPAALSHSEAAKIIGASLGKEVPHVAISGDQLKAGAMENGMPESSADYLVMLYDLAKQGLMAEVTSDVEQILGRAPIGFGEAIKN